jgi:hypothetical protein
VVTRARGGNLKIKQNQRVIILLSSRKWQNLLQGRKNVCQFRDGFVQQQKILFWLLIKSMNEKFEKWHQKGHETSSTLHCQRKRFKFIKI